MTPLLSIQYLRAIAALAVVAYHAGQWITAPVAVGAAGVDVFFVISGFVMWITTDGRTVSPWRFLRRRAERVIPLYWTATLALAVVATLAPGVFPHVTPQAWHIARSLLFIPHGNPEGAGFPLLAVGWTLDYEALFYLVFAALLLTPQAGRLTRLALALAALSALGLAYPAAYTLLFNPMLMQFAAGAAIGRLWILRALPGPGAGAGLIALGLALLGAGHVLGVVPESLLRPAAWGAPAALLVIGAVSLEAAGRLPRWAALARLGDASFSIYLIHHPLMALFNRIIGPTDPLLFFALAMALSIGAGLACHCWIERPLLALFRRPYRASAVAEAHWRTPQTRPTRQV